jgi:superfamily II DNA/RNA helicase
MGSQTLDTVINAIQKMSHRLRRNCLLVCLSVCLPAYLPCKGDITLISCFSTTWLPLCRNRGFIFMQHLPRLHHVHALILWSCTHQAYQLRLFLESFGIRTALLNAELPLNSRSHILHAFNEGLFDHLIATGDMTNSGAEKGVGGK